MKKHPELFSDFEIERVYTSSDDQVKIAEELAKENNGILPYGGWLALNGYSSLYHAIQTCPVKFSHIKMDKKGKNINDWIKIAEKLAKENNGILPSYSWLKKNKFSSLVFFMRKYPKKFDHIKQRYDGGKTIEEQVKIAEKLTKENNGKLPCQHWLKRHEHFGLAHMLRRHPDAFSHLKKERKVGNTIEQNVKLAEQLAKKNGGILPHSTKLIKDGFSGISHMLHRYPNKFNHIKRDFKTCRTVDDQVKIAEKLAKENNGILPSPKWLRDNDHWGLSQLLYRNPNKFSHLKQEFKKGVRTIGE